jgi:hypothetical protein
VVAEQGLRAGRLNKKLMSLEIANMLAGLQNKQLSYD